MVLIGSVLLALIGAAILYALYTTLRMRWPDAYSSMSDTYSLRLRDTWQRFTLYRFAPVFIVALGVTVTADRQHVNSLLALCVMIAVHVWQTNGRAFVRDLLGKRERGDFRPNYAAYHAAMSALVAIAGAGAYVLRHLASPLVPSSEALTESLWTAALVAVCAGFLISLVGSESSKGMRMGGEYLSRRAIADIGLSTVDYAYSKAVELGADPILIRAIMYAEVIQRPRWFRNIEARTWWIRRTGTYGLMQVASARPMSDRESIDRACAQLAGAWGASYLSTESYSGWEVDWRKSWADLGYRNGDGAFIEMVNEIYRPNFYAYASQTASIQESIGDIRINYVRRHAVDFGIRGMTAATHVVLCYRLDEELVSFGVTRPSQATGTWAWELRVPPASKNVVLITFDDAGQIRGGGGCSLDVGPLDWELPFTQ